ncbi:MAG: hypothetical protein JSV04_06580 [Candidatus Heimdallarchaeota archaeon]|nr:MAG: hypothetical protein JSV04_06580 [Candidatus Heimdallarchaeota archaeon]
MTQPKVDFEQIKGILLNKSPEELKEFICSETSQVDAMFLFWALDYLDQHPQEIPDTSKIILQKNRDFLGQVQKTIFSESLEFSLGEYSAGFVLGTLEFGIREREAQIDRYKEYVELLAKIQTWPELGFPNEEFKKHWEERINDIEEIRDWMRMRANDWYPIILPLYRSRKFEKSPKIVLKTLRKGRTDKTVFQILTAMLHSNPILDQQIKNFCEENQVLKVEKETLIELLQLLAHETSDTKVKAYCQLLIGAKTRKE